MLDFLQAAVMCRLNIIVSGGTGAGKTTMLNVLSSFVSDAERVVTVEDAAELMLRQHHVDKARNTSTEHRRKGRVRQRDLAVNALRMRPDRIIVGEVRGAEALDMLQAMNTGHDGGLTTIHANTARDALHSGHDGGDVQREYPERAVRQQTASAINLVIQLTRLGRDAQDHGITEVTAVGDIVSMQDIFVFDPLACGVTGRCADDSERPASG